MVTIPVDDFPIVDENNGREGLDLEHLTKLRVLVHIKLGEMNRPSSFCNKNIHEIQYKIFEIAV